MSIYIEFNNVTKNYAADATNAIALKDASFGINRGELCVIVGPSGAGKTTVLNILGGIDRCSYGTVMVNGDNITRYNDRQLTSYRRNQIGFVFQFYNLIPTLTALENVQLASEICSDPFDENSIFEVVGLDGKQNSFPAQLSGGEQQRVAIARAVVKCPDLLLCDEPTGALDSKTGGYVLQILQELSSSLGTTVVIITHNPAIAQMAHRIIRMRNSGIESIEINPQPKDAAEIIL
jgi:putative ABC transport system ATP-binding protein